VTTHKEDNIIDYDSYHRNFLCYKHRSKKIENNERIKNNYEKHAIKQIKKQKEFFLSENKLNELNELKLKNTTLV
jgi:protein-arginine kinase activator protein McsA